MVRKYENTLVRQKQILDAARKVIVEAGSENLTVKKIAGEVGISEAAIYRHFRSKKAILSFLVDNMGETLAGDIHTELRPGQTPLEILDNTLQNHLSNCEQRKGIIFQVMAEIVSLGDKRLNRKLSTVIESYTGSLKELLREGVRSGEIRDDIDLDVTAMVIFGMVQGMVNIWALYDYNFDFLQKYRSVWSVLNRALVKV